MKKAPAKLPWKAITIGMVAQGAIVKLLVPHLVSAHREMDGELIPILDREIGDAMRRFRRLSTRLKEHQEAQAPRSTESIAQLRARLRVLELQETIEHLDEQRRAR